MKIKLSIITVNFNNKDGLIKTANSIYTQSFLPYNWVIIDNNSQDSSITFLKDYLKLKHFLIPHIKIISEQDKGIYDGMNKGITYSCGNYLLFLNSGDFFYNNDSIQTIVNTISSKPDVDFYQFGFVYMGKKRFPKPIWWNIWKMNTSHQAIVFSKEIFISESYNLRYKFASDYELLNRLKFTKKSYLRVNHYLIENELYGSKKFLKYSEKEYYDICKLYYPKFLCIVMSIFRRIYSRLINL